MKNLGWTLSALLIAHLGTGCGDGPLCPDDATVLISIPNGTSFTQGADENLNVPGTQVGVSARTNLRSGTLVEIEVISETGTPSRYRGFTDESGNVDFKSVTFRDGSSEVIVTAVAATGCGATTQTIFVFAGASTSCNMELGSAPLDNGNYPYPVYNASHDMSPALGFQTQVQIQATPGLNAFISILDLATGEETLSDSITVDEDGVANFDLTLEEGGRFIRGICKEADGSAQLSRAQSVLVDTIGPKACSITKPTNFVTPADDTDQDPSNGLQVQVAGSFSAASDIDPNGTRFTVGERVFPATLASSTEAEASAEFGSPGSSELAFQVADLAGNLCETKRTVRVDTDGCAITLVHPLSGDVVSQDSSDIPGFQASIAVMVDPSCVGRPVVTDCGNGATGNVPASGEVTFEVTLSDDNLAEGEEVCRTSVTALSGFTTFADVSFTYDNRGPAVQIFAASPLECGGTVMPADDANKDPSDGIQVDVIVVAPEADDLSVTVNGGADIPVGASGDTAFITVKNGDNIVIAEGRDAAGNIGQAVCNLELLEENPGPEGLTVSGLTRQSVRLEFTAPAGAGSYVGRYASEPISAENFDTVGTEFSFESPLAAGQIEKRNVDQIRPGIYYFGIAARDGGGNVSSLITDGPVLVDFDQTGSLLPPNAGDGNIKAFGFRMVRGNFNGDSFDDLAVSAPNTSNPGGDPGGGAVHIYFGSESGLPATPSQTIVGALTGTLFGQGMTRIKWNDDAIDDLAIGAPFADGIDGKVYIFLGASDFAPAGLEDADATISVDQTTPGFFNFSALGWNLATVNFNGDDNLEDLAITAVNGGSGQGGVLIIYGGTATSSEITLSDVAPVPMVSAHLLKNPEADFNGRSFGETLANAGRTEGTMDATDDLSIGYANDDSRMDVTEKLFILRGRGSAAPVGITDITMGTNDLTITDSLSDRTTGLGRRVSSVPDYNGDGARDLLISSHTRGSNQGSVFLVSGAQTGTVGIEDPSFLIARMHGIDEDIFGTDVLSNQTGGNHDIDNDGVEDIVIAGGSGANTRLYVWYGGKPLTGVISSLSADHVILAPAEFTNPTTLNFRPALVGTWADVNGDGLDDICWADRRAASGEGRIEIVYDASQN